MRIITDIREADATRPSVITIGNFDGVHTGHQSLIREVKMRAESCGGIPTAITFDPHPAFFFKGVIPGFLLTQADEKAALLGKYGIERLIRQRFDESLRTTRALDYVQLLVHHLHPCEIWVGPDFALGFEREGTVDFLRKTGETRGFTVHTPEFLTNEAGIRVSSSMIRSSLVEGRVTEAKRLLGRPYRVSGEVVPGSRRGRTIGFPTANVDVAEEKVIPSRGVFAAFVELNGIRYESVTNIGFRPTFNMARFPVVEAHILDFNEDIYGETLSIDFLEKIRDEKKFESIDKLIDQINEDILTARRIFWEKSY